MARSTSATGPGPPPANTRLSSHGRARRGTGDQRGTSGVDRARTDRPGTARHRRPPRLPDGVQAGAARRVVHSDPAGAAASLRTIESSTRTAVAELHRMLTTPRDDGGPAPTDRARAALTRSRPSLPLPVRWASRYARARLAESGRCHRPSGRCSTRSRRRPSRTPSSTRDPVLRSTFGCDTSTTPSSFRSETPARVSVPQPSAPVSGISECASGWMPWAAASKSARALAAATSFGPKSPPENSLIGQVAHAHRRRSGSCTCGIPGDLQSEPGITIVGEARNGEEAVAGALALRPDVV